MTRTDEIKLPGRTNSRRAAVAAGLGTLIEMYDFAVYAYAAAIIAPLFFPNDDPTASLMGAFAAFALAYLVRPIGGVLFGHLGDRKGRRVSLLTTVLLMGICSALIGVLPTYEHIGTMAAVLLLACRLGQGMAAGGETGGAATFVSESAPEKRKARYGVVTAMGATGGFAVAASVVGVISLLTTEQQMQSWGWRIPFLLSIPLVIICIWARTRIFDPPLADREERNGLPILSVLRNSRAAVATAAGLSIALNGSAFIGYAYLSVHLTQQLSYPPTPVYWITAGSIACSVVLMVPAGRLADRVGLIPVGAAGCTGLLVITLPGMMLMGVGNLWLVAIAYVAILAGTSFLGAAVYTLTPQLFPREARITGVTLGWNIGQITAGGTGPLLSVWIVEFTGNSLSPGLLVAAMSLFGIAALIAARRNISDRPLAGVSSAVSSHVE